MKALVTNAEDWVTLAVTRSLGRHGVDVTAASYRKSAMTFHSRYCSHRMFYPDPRKVGDSVADHMLKLVKSNRFDVFFPAQEDVLIPVAKQQDKFRQYVRLPMPDFDTIDKTDDKSRTFREAMKAGLDIPRTLFMEDLGDLKSAVKDLQFPILIKPYRGAGSVGQTVLNSPKNLEEIFRRTVARYGPSMIQEYVLWDRRYSFSTIFNEKHEPVRFCLVRSIREYPITGGPLVYSVTVRDDNLKELSLRLMKSLSWYGIANGAFIVDKRDGRPKFIEINPRFFGSLPLPIAAGVDHPWVLFQLAMEEKIKPDLSYRLGVKARHVFPEDLKYLLDVLRGRPRVSGFRRPGKVRTMAGFMKIYEKNLTYYVFSKDDPAPFIYDLSHFFHEKYNRVLQKLPRGRRKGAGKVFK